MSGFWNEKREPIRQHLIDWWKHDGLVLTVLSNKSSPDPVAPPPPPPPKNLQEAWCDLEYRRLRAEHEFGYVYYGADAFEYYDTQIGPGTLGAMLGSRVQLSQDTVWYHPIIEDADATRDIRLDRSNHWYQLHMAMCRDGMKHANGRYLVGIPDLIENFDTLATLRECQTLLIDMLERPRWVKRCISQINQAYFEAFNDLYDVVRDEYGGNAFSAFHIWGPGKTAKVQCDASAMISADMFNEFVVPALTEQCRWLDYSMHHLDGTQAVHHLDSLLKIDALDAIEWTPQSGIEGGGHPRWHAMYRKILEAGKSVQAIGVTPQEVVPLLDACGTRGMYIMCYTHTQDEAEQVLAATGKYRH